MGIKSKSIFSFIISIFLFGFLSACGEKKDQQWEWVIESGKYEDIYFVGEDRVALRDQSGKFAIANLRGEAITPFQYDSIAQYCEGLAVVSLDESCYYIDSDGAVVIEGVYQAAGNFSEGIGAVMADDLWGFIDKSGEQIVPCIYQARQSFHEGRCGVRGDEGWGFIDAEGRVIVPMQYEEIKAFREERAAVKQDGKWRFIDRAGNTVGGLSYEEAESFYEGRAAVKTGGKWGFVDLQGNLCIECFYDDVGHFSEGKAAVKKEAFQEGCDAWAYIDQEGQVVIDFYPYEAAGSETLWVNEFHDGKAFVTKTISCIINSNGEDIFPDSAFFISEPVYNKEYDMIPGYVFTDADMTMRKYGMVGLNGEQRVEPVFDGIISMQGRYVIVSEYIDGKAQKGMIRITGGLIHQACGSNAESSFYSDADLFKEVNADSRIEEDTASRDNSSYEEINVEDVFKIFRCKMTRHEIGDLIDIEISYPQISYDIDTAAVINSKLYEKAVKEDVKKEMTEWHGGRLNYYLDYKITYSSTELISVLYKNDNECFGVNYDLETGEIIEIGQYISTDIIRELLKTEKDSFYEEILKKAIEENIEDDLTDFFIWEKGIGLIAWPMEGGGKDYFIININLEEKKVTWEI